MVGQIVDVVAAVGEPADLPFDVAQGRTITIDTSDIYSIADRLASAQRELSQHLKHIMASEQNEPSEDNPVHLYLPKLKVTVG